MNVLLRSLGYFVFGGVVATAITLVVVVAHHAHRTAMGRVRGDLR
ncbi:MAG: hypothetical protein JWP11_2821 [Frankiales bacterium]|nr:hypothetical protein [Frankiales bacterium]